MKNRVDGLSRGRGINADRFIPRFMPRKPLYTTGTNQAWVRVWGCSLTPRPCPTASAGVDSVHGVRVEAQSKLTALPKVNVCVGDALAAPRSVRQGQNLLFAKQIKQELSCKGH